LDKYIHILLGRFHPALGTSCSEIAPRIGVCPGPSYLGITGIPPTWVYTKSNMNTPENAGGR